MRARIYVCLIGAGLLTHLAYQRAPAEEGESSNDCDIFETNVFLHLYLSKCALSKAMKRIELALFSIVRVK